MVIVMEVRVGVVVMEIGGRDCAGRGADDEGVFLQDMSFITSVRSSSDWVRGRRLTLNVLLTETSKLSPCS